MELVVAAGITDVWQEYFHPDDDAGGEVQCVTLSSFLLYLCSDSTYAVRVEKRDTSERFCILQVFGPECAKHGRLYIQYELAATQFKELFKEEIAMLKSALKRHVKRTDPEFHKAGVCDAREALRALGQTF